MKLPGGMDLQAMMQQAQQMQDNMKRVQEQLGAIEVEGQSGAGLVKVVMTCHNDVKRVTIDPSLLADDKDMLEDLVAGQHPAMRMVRGPGFGVARREARGFTGVAGQAGLDLQQGRHGRSSFARGSDLDGAIRISAAWIE